MSSLSPPQEPPQPGGSQKPTVVYDAGCDHCERWAKRVSAKGHAHHEGGNVTAVEWHGNRSYRGAAATVRALWAMRGGWWVLGCVLWLIPSPLREWGYRRCKHA